MSIVSFFVRSNYCTLVKFMMDLVGVIGLCAADIIFCDSCICLNYFFQRPYEFSVLMTVGNLYGCETWSLTLREKQRHTHSLYVIHIAVPLQQWSCERASALRYTYTVCLIEC